MSEETTGPSWCIQVSMDRVDRFAIIDEMRAAFKDVPPEEIEREAERALAQVRDEMRREREQITDVGD